MKFRLVSVFLCLLLFCGCVRNTSQSSPTVPLIAWGGIPAEKADTLYVLAKECGFDMHLGLYRAQESALRTMDAAARAGIGIIIDFPQIRDSTEKAVQLIRNHPALVAYHVKDEPDTSHFTWLADVRERIMALDSEHPCYINLYPNWAWGVEEYADKIEMYASMIDVPFYSFDHYPVTEVDGEIHIRPEWYRNLEEFSAMSRRHGKPFWAFALAASHHLGPPSPPAFYPEPTLGQIRLQVFSDLLYGAQAIQYFTFAGLVDSKTCAKKPAFEIIRQVNAEVKAYSPVFLNCNVLDVWHIGDSIPSHTKPLDIMPHRKVEHLKMNGNGVVSLIKKDRNTYLAIQNSDCQNSAVLDIMFSSRVRRQTLDGEVWHDGSPVELSPGNVVIFKL